MSGYLFIYTTFPEKEVAEKIISALLTERLIACANLLPAITAHYWWQGKQEKTMEIAAYLKTTAAHFEQVKSRILALHPYTCPCIVALPVLAGYAPYLEWIEKETTHVP